MKMVIEVNDEDGSVMIDGQPVKDAMEAVDMVKMAVGAGEGEPEGEAMQTPAQESAETVDTEGAEDPEMQESESEAGAEQHGGNVDKTLGAKMPMVDKNKKGMRPKVKPNWEDYGI